MRIRNVSNKKEMRMVMDELYALGYNCPVAGDEAVKMVKHSYGSFIAHLLIFILTFWTLGFVNLLYFMYNYVTKSDEVLVKLEGGC
ncbi:MAG: hypothetical protein K8E24_015220 [Methanobacterium paludis]|nr:hypothetical protein [Methanobacterium paludis]